MPVVTRRQKKAAAVKQEDVDYQSFDTEAEYYSEDDDYIIVIAGLTMNDIRTGGKGNSKMKSARWSPEEKNLVVSEGIKGVFCGSSLPTAEQILTLLSHWAIPYSELGRRCTEMVIQRLVSIIRRLLDEKSLCRLIRAKKVTSGNGQPVVKISIASALSQAVHDKNFSVAWFSNQTDQAPSTMDHMHEKHNLCFDMWVKPAMLGESGLIKEAIKLLLQRQAFRKVTSAPIYTPSPLSSLGVQAYPLSGMPCPSMTFSKITRHLSLLRYARSLAQAVKLQRSLAEASVYLAEIAQLKADNGGDWQFRG